MRRYPVPSFFTNRKLSSEEDPIYNISYLANHTAYYTFMINAQTGAVEDASISCGFYAEELSVSAAEGMYCI